MSEPRHGPDFRCVRVDGVIYEFTPMQARVIKVLWEAWEAGTPTLPGKEILRLAESDTAHLRRLFTHDRVRHPAWGNLLIRGNSRGTYRLSLPDR